MLPTCMGHKTETFMSDGGSHFKNHEVTNFCTEWGTKHHVAPAYSPWVNGLVEGANKLLIYILARSCAPEIGEDGWHDMTADQLPRTWPDHFEWAITILNHRILPTLKFSPKEILLGMVVNTSNTSIADATAELAPTNVDTHMTYICGTTMP